MFAQFKKDGLPYVITNTYPGTVDITITMSDLYQNFILSRWVIIFKGQFQQTRYTSKLPKQAQLNWLVRKPRFHKAVVGLVLLRKKLLRLSGGWYFIIFSLNNLEQF